MVLAKDKMYMYTLYSNTVEHNTYLKQSKKPQTKHNIRHEHNNNITHNTNESLYHTIQMNLKTHSKTTTTQNETQTQHHKRAKQLTSHAISFSKIKNTLKRKETNKIKFHALLVYKFIQITTKLKWLLAHILLFCFGWFGVARLLLIELKSCHSFTFFNFIFVLLLSLVFVTYLC